ncbi:hypothetical protein ACJMK2_027563 [Sinanodonta woodiana]|uniref:Sacsin n=1 Tax=Sinanodonta woodiana TaxID=1069815 RepID=A0ABD3X5W2_SINWO
MSVEDCEHIGDSGKRKRSAKNSEREMDEDEEAKESTDDSGNNAKRKRHAKSPAREEDELEESTDESADSSDENGCDVLERSGMIRPSLIKDLKNILSEYPDDGQIIKELLQNAEDAGATKVKLLLSGKKCNQELSAERPYKKFFKGPGLCVYNDAEFTEKDWEGIRMLNSSVKEKDPIKVGRFGLGFKSVYHITDYPCIISGDQLLLLNPHEPEDQVCSLMKLHDMSRSTRADCLEALNNVFGFSSRVIKKKYYKGTLFWFPLRDTPTVLSNTVYTNDKVLDLFKSFQTEAHSILIFLKSLASVELFCMDTGTQFDHGMVKPLLVVKAEMNPASQERKTKFIKQVIKLNGGCSDRDLASCRHVHVSITKAEEEKEPKTTVDWTVVDFYKGGEMSDILKRLLSDRSLSYCPYVGVAMCESFSNGFQKGGHIFCFMPLPQETKSLTGLPVHVNGLFALSRNRRHLKWSSAEQESQDLHKDSSIQWNQCLVQEILPSAYCMLIQEMVNHCTKHGNQRNMMDLVYASLPDMAKVDDKWMSLVEKVMDSLWDMLILFTESDGGMWITPKNALFSSFNCYSTLSKECKENVKKTLKMYDQNWVDVPHHVGVYFLDKPGILDLNPNKFCEILTIRPRYLELSFEEKVSILEFLMADTDYHKLKGLHLLPLQDGNFAPFTSRQDCHEKIFLEKPHVIDLFPGLENRFLHVRKLTQHLEHFEKMLSCEMFQLYQLEPATTLLNLLQEAIQLYFGNKYPVEMQTLNSNFMVNNIWIENIWAYLIENKIPPSLIEQLPLVPHLGEGKYWTDVKLLKLYRLKDHLLLQKGFGLSSFTEDICEALEYLSITVLSSLPPFIPYEYVQAYIGQPTQASVLNIFTSIQKSGKLECIEHFNRNASESSRKELLEYLGKSQISEWNEHCRQFVWKLQIFQEGDSFHGKTSMRLASAADIGIQCPAGGFPVQFPCRLITAESSGANLASLIGLERASMQDLVQKTLKAIQKGSYSPEDVTTFMMYLVDNISLYKKCTEIINIAKSISFLRNSALKLCKPDELFDPWDENLKILFYNEDRFPIDAAIMQSNRRQALIDLGLRLKQNIRASDLLETAKVLDSSSQGKVEANVLCKKAKEFMETLNVSDYLFQEINGIPLACHIENLKCIYHKTSSVNGYPTVLKWYGQATVLSKPTDIRSIEYSGSVGSAMSLIDCENLPTLADYFKWRTSPPAYNVYAHLQHLTEQHDEPTLFRLVLDTYTELNKLYSSYRTEMKKPNFQCIWHGEGFTFPRNVYINKSVDLNLKPYLYRLPAELSHYQGLFEWMGCHTNLAANVLLDIQWKMNEKYQSISKGIYTLNEVNHDRQLIIRILEILKEHANELTDEESCKLLFPVQTDDDFLLILKSSKECVCSLDETWLCDAGYSEEDGLFHVHKDVSMTTAQQLGVKSLSQNLVSDAEGFEEWGQEEPLTRRIHNLLDEGYTDGFSFPKEIIQNADDACATEVCFLYDERENHDAMKRLLDVGMAECQGPALWAYNNAEFSPEDLKNLTQLSGATKANDTTKIGKFGLGFCSVYNLTDVPSLVTGYDIVIFDPHKTHLGKALPGPRPGLRINLASQKNRKLLQRLDHQFKPYQNIFGCTLRADAQNPYKGTLFRFPFRSTSKSEIKSHPYLEKDRIDLLKKLIEYGGNILLFTQNVLKVKLFHLPKDCMDPSKMKLLYTIEKSHLDPCIPERKSVLQQMAELCQNNISLSTNQFEAVQRISIRTSIKKVTSKVIQGINNFIGDVKTDWLISWTSGQNECLHLMGKLTKSVVPLGAVAVLVDKDKNSCIMPRSVNQSPLGFYKESHFFCFLPLPLTTTLPVHINATFAVTSDRKQLRVSTQDENKTVESEWNDALLGDAVCSAYLHLLKYLSKAADISVNYDCFQLWPFGSCSRISILKTNFYKKLVTENWEIFRGEGGWTAFSNCLFLDKLLTTPKNICKISLKTVSEFKKIKTDVVIDLPEKFYDLIAESHKMQITERTVARKSFILDIFFPNTKSEFWKYKKKERNEMTLDILFSKRDNDINKEAQHTACIPTEPHGDLQMPKEVVHPEGDIAEMFTNDDGRFPVKSFRTKTILDALEDWGIMKSKINTELLVERCQSIPVLANNDMHKSLQRYTAVMRYLEKLQREKLLDNETLYKIREIPFLPVMPKPSGWPFKWKSEEELKGKDSQSAVTYARADQLFSQRHHSKEVISCCSKLIRNVNDHQYDTFKICIKLGLQEIEAKLETFERIEEQLLEISKTLKEQQVDLNILRQCKQYIYEYFNTMCSEEWAKRRLTRFQGSLVVFIDDHFVLPNRAYFQHQWDCKPEFYRVKDFERYQLFYSAVGVRSIIPPIEICQVLNSMKEEWKDQQLPKQKLRLTLNLLHCLSESLCETNETNSNLKIIALDSDGVLTPVSQLCFDDHAISSRKKMSFVHPHISEHVGKTLGIKTKSKKMLHDCSRKMGFGQHEDLLTRLNRILEKYPLDFGILKELLQNADDAGATEVHFIKDYRQLGTGNIFDESYAPLQGPALCVYNNSPFTQADLEGIQKLGLGSKRNDRFKSGQYGVGFNVVYHLTDVPSFLTKGPEVGETLCFFDPMCCYIPEATKQYPGMRYVELEEIRESCSDVFEGYLESEIFSSDNGTIFRFPLRNKQMAEVSEISKVVISASQMDGLLEGFKEEIFVAVLFVKNVTQIVFSKVNDDGKVEIEYKVEAYLSNEDMEKRTAFFQHAKQNILNVTDALPSKHETDYILKIEDTEGMTQTWHVFQDIGFENCTSQMVESLKAEFVKHLPMGGVAGLCSSLDCPPSVNGQAFCNLPLPVFTGLPVHINGHFVLDDEGRRNLWMDKMDVRTTWNSLLIEHAVMPAYVRLIQCMRRDLCPHDIVQNRVMESQLTSYFKIFPSFTNAKGDYWEKLTKYLYQYIINNEENVFPVVQDKGKKCSLTWIPFTEKGQEFPSYFDIENIPGAMEILISRKQPKHNTLMPEFKLETTVLKDLSLKIIHSNIEIYQSMSDSGMDVSYLTPDSAIKFLKSQFSTNRFCTMSETGKDLSKSVMKNMSRVLSLLYYCARSESFLEQLDGLPLLVANDNTLHVFSKDNPVYFSLFVDLHIGCAGKFLHKKLVKFFQSKFQNQVDIWQTGVFLKLDIEHCMTILKDTLPADTLQQQKYLEWDHSAKELPNKQWIIRFWEFINVQTKEEFPSINHNISEFEFLKCKFEQHKNWCLLPAVIEENNSEKFYLVPIFLSFTLFDTSNIENPQLKIVLEKLALPKICRFGWEKKFEMGIQIMQTLVSQTNRPTDLLNGLCFHKNSILVKKILSKDECIVVLDYFCQQMERPEMIDDIAYMKSLKSLPLFVTHTGNVSSLEHFLEVVIAPSTIPVDGLNQLMSFLHVCFLEKIEKLSKLLKRIGTEIETHEEFYCKFIIPKFAYIPEENKLTHLEYIRDCIVLKHALDGYTVKQKEVISLMKKWDFISVGYLRRKASDFVSPFIDVFKAMCKDDQFPPEPFRSKEWKQFMQLAGMVSEVTADQFCQFAEDLSSQYKRSKTLPDELARKSKILCEHLFSHDKLKEDNILRRVSLIEFIPPFKVDHFLGNIFRQYQNRKYPIAFSGSIYSKYANLAWTCCPVLPDWIFPTHLQESLNILSKPYLKDVITHTQNICEVLQKDFQSQDNRHDLDRIDLIMTDIYKFLQNHSMQEKVMRERLYKTPILFIPDGHCFVQAAHVIREGDEIRPYLFKYPMKYGPFYELFVCLGTTERADINHYAEVLNLIHEKCEMNELLPDERSKVQNAIRGLLSCLSANNRGDQNIRVDILYLPDEKWSLVNAKELIVSDHSVYRKKIEACQTLKFFCGFRQIQIEVVNERETLFRFPNQWRPDLLSKIVTKRLDLDNSNLSIVHSEKSQQLQRFLSSEEVVIGLMRLLQNENAAIEEQLVRTNLANTTVQHVQTIGTCFYFRDQKVNGTRENNIYWLDSKRENNQTVLYFTMHLCSEQQLYEKLESPIKEILNMCTNKLLHNKFEHLMTIARCITCPERIAKLLDEAEICSYDSADRYTFHTMDFIPQLGAYVPEKYHAMLDNSFIMFDIGEIVAFEIEDQWENDSPVFVFAKVLKKVDSSMASSEIDVKYDIDLGSETRTVMATILYRFIRRKVDGLSVVLRTSPSKAESSNELKEIKGIIRKTLKEAWTKDEKEKRQIIKRLYLKWHPDKNPGNEALCTKVFQYIQHLIYKFENGQFEDSKSDDDDDASKGPGHYRTRSHYRHTSQQRYSQWDSFFDFMGRRARKHRHQYQSYSESDFSYSGFSFEPSPQPREAQRWQKQAVLDLDAAKETQRTAEALRLHNWVCYQCHQAAEKSLKAARFAIDGNNVMQYSHDLVSIATGLSNTDLIKLARQLQDLVGDHTRMRYPDRFCMPSIPADFFTSEHSAKACDLTQEILNLVDKMLK